MGRGLYKKEQGAIGIKYLRGTCKNRSPKIWAAATESKKAEIGFEPQKREGAPLRENQLPSFRKKKFIFRDSFFGDPQRGFSTRSCAGSKGQTATEMPEKAGCCHGAHHAAGRVWNPGAYPSRIGPCTVNPCRPMVLDGVSRPQSMHTDATVGRAWRWSDNSRFRGS